MKRHKIIIVCCLILTLMVGCSNVQSGVEMESSMKETGVKTEVQSQVNNENTIENETKETIIESETLLSRDKSTYTNDITYDMLARTPDKYIDCPIKFTGTITQIIGSHDEYNCFRMNVDDNTNYNLLVICPEKILDFNLLVDDNITIYGGFLGLFTYETVLGDELTVPCVEAVMMDYNEKSTIINISVELPICPITVNEYIWDDEISNTVRFDNITAKYEESWDGTYYVTFTFAGEKTYGNDGYVYIGYKLYDSENYIVDSGTFMTGKLSSGDKFKNMEESIYNLEPGTYRLEIMDYK